MAAFEHSEPEDVRPLVARAATGDRAAWEQLIARYRGRLRRMIALRIHPNLQGRLDPSDILQEVFLDVTGKLTDYLNESVLPFFLWLRLKTGDRIQRLHRHHLGTQSRDASREVSLFHGFVPEASSLALANHLLGREHPPDEQLQKHEQIEKLRFALEQLDLVDREALVLRHFEQLTSAEVAQVLGISTAAAAKRYFRAVGRLKELLAGFPGGLASFGP